MRTNSSQVLEINHVPIPKVIQIEEGNEKVDSTSKVQNERLG